MGLPAKDAQRFESKVNRTPGHDACHEWLGGVDTHGYGQFWLQGRNRVATHVAWEVAGRAKNACLLHTCDNRKCVRLEHLYEGTPAKNAQDAKARQRIARGTAHHLARLDEQAVVQIRALYSAGSTQDALAVTFGVGQTTISCVLRGRTWAHVVG